MLLRANRLSSAIGIQKRYITIQQPVNTVSFVTDSTSFHQNSNENETGIEKIDLLKEPQFETIGNNNQCTLSVTMPASIPLHVRKGSVMAVFPSASIASNTESLTTNIKGYFSGMNFQRILSTTPVKIFVSSYSKGNNTTTRGFVHLLMDGTKDWVVFNQESIQAYSGNDMELIPSSLSGSSWKDRISYTLLKGRGLCALVGDGDIFKITLNKNESLQVRTDDLLAMNITSSSDLNILKKTVWKNGFQSPVEDKVVTKATEFTTLGEDCTNMEKASFYTQKILKTGFKFFKSSFNHVTDYVFGNGDYYTVTGPRSILIQSGSGKRIPTSSDLYSLLQTKQDVSQVEKFIQKESAFKSPVTNEEDNYGVVRIVDGHVQSYKNIKNFDEEVQRIEGLKK